MKATPRSFVVTIGALFLVACAGGGEPRTDAATSQRQAVQTPAAVAPLRVGVSTNFPPIIFRQNNRILGAEADLARALAQALNRPLEFVELTWERQIPALLGGQIDIIMSGMSITRARAVRVAFTEPYLRSGLFPMMRPEDLGRFATRQKILQTNATVGVVRGTTGDAFVQKNLPRARIWYLATGLDAPLALARYKIDLFIHDGPALAWIASENEGQVAVRYEALNEEYLAWALRREDAALRAQVNDVLRLWQEDGTLTTVLQTWLPYLSEPPPSGAAIGR